MNDVVCSECGIKSKIKFKERQLPKGIKETYIKCPICSDHKTCFITDKKVRELQKEVNRLRNKSRKTIEIINDIQAKQNEIIKRMDDLLQKHGRR